MYELNKHILKLNKYASVEIKIIPVMKVLLLKKSTYLETHLKCSLTCFMKESCMLVH